MLSQPKSHALPPPAARLLPLHELLGPRRAARERFRGAPSAAAALREGETALRGEARPCLGAGKGHGLTAGLGAEVRRPGCGVELLEVRLDEGKRGPREPESSRKRLDATRKGAEKAGAERSTTHALDG